MFQVLLCDDELSVTNFLKTSIPWESLGIQNIFTASDGKEALALFDKNRIDLLITDIRMPRMDGLKLLEAVRQKSPDTHCILLTAYGEFEYARAAFRLGVDNYLLKPIQLGELTDTIENTVENMYLHRRNKEALFRENILRRWLGGNIGEDELGERSNLLPVFLLCLLYDQDRPFRFPFCLYRTLCPEPFFLLRLPPCLGQPGLLCSDYRRP